MTTRIQTANYTRIRRPYLTEVVEPALAKLQKSAGLFEQCYAIAGANILLKNYHPMLAERFALAFEHLPSPNAGVPNLTAYIWDSVGSGIELTPPWENPEYFSLDVNLRQESRDGFVGVYSHYDDTMTLYDPERGRAYFWIRDAATLPVWVSAAPLRTLLQWFLGSRGVHLIHGAVVGNQNGAILLTAKGGSGKSTTALACVRSGLGYLADDYVAVSEEASPRAHSLYNSIKVAPYLGNHFDPECVSHTEGEKSIVYLNKLFPEQMLPSAPLRAILIPKIMHRDKTAIVPASRREAMLALVPTTLFQLPLPESDKMRALSSIIAALPCFTLELGTDSDEAAEAIKRYLDRP